MTPIEGNETLQRNELGQATLLRQLRDVQDHNRNLASRVALFDKLWHSAPKDAVIAAIGGVLSRSQEDKKSALGALILIRRLCERETDGKRVDSSSQSHSPLVCEVKSDPLLPTVDACGSSAEGAIELVCVYLAKLAGHAREIAMQKNISEELRVATVFATSAADAVIAWAYAVASVRSRGMSDSVDSALPFGAVSDLVSDVIGRQSEWFGTQRPLYVVGLNAVASSIATETEALMSGVITAESAAESFYSLVTAFAPLILVSAGKTQSAKEAAGPVESLLSSFDSSRDPETDLIRVCLVLGKHSQESIARSGVVDSVLHRMALFLTSNSAVVQSLGVALLKAVVPSGDAREEAKLVEPLLSLLGSSDVVSRAAAELVSELACRHPKRILEMVFEHLDSDMPAKRREALEIVSCVARSLCSGTSPLSASSVAKREETTRIVVDGITSRLSDEELSVRACASTLFGTLCEPVYCIAKLAPLTAHSDARTRSAADNAVVSTMLSCASAEPRFRDSVAAYIDTMRCTAPVGVPRRVPATPADIEAEVAPNNMKPAQAADSHTVAERLARLIPKWGGGIPPELWGSISGTVLAKLLSFPGDSAVVVAFREMAPFVAARGSQSLVAEISERLGNQLSLSDEMLSPESPQSQSVGPLLFERITPLLALKMLPLSSLEHCGADVTRNVRSQLLARLTTVMEFDEVRKLAAECIARLPLKGVLPELVGVLLPYLRDSGSHVLARAVVYALSCSMSVQPDCAATLLESPVLWSELLRVVEAPETATAMCAAASDCLVLLIANDPAGLMSSLLLRVANSACDVSCSCGVRMRFVSVLSAFAKIAQSEESQLFVVRTLSAIAQSLLCDCSASVGPLRSSTLHALFLAVHRLGGSAGVAALDLHGLALSATRSSPDEGSRLAAMTLLGALLAGVSQRLFDPQVGGSETALEETREFLGAVASSDVSTKVQGLARQLFELAFRNIQH